MSKVLITGGTGFIGSHIAEEFYNKSVNVVLLVREGSDLSNIENLKCEMRIGDVRDKESLKSAMEGLDFIIHNSALVKDWGDYSEFYETNVVGVRNLLEAARESGIKNIIMTGTNSVYGEEDSKVIKNENSTLISHYNYFLDKIFPCKLNYYRDSKRDGKLLAIDFAQKEEMNLTIVEPVWVYGERELRGGFYQYIKSVKDGMIGVPGGKSNKFHVIYVNDLAKIYYKIYEKMIGKSSEHGINCYIVGNEESENMYRTYSIFCHEAGLKMPFLIPKILIYPIGFIMESFYTVFKMKSPPTLTRGRVNMFYDNIEYSPKKIQDYIDIQYTPLEKGIQATVLWYKSKELI